MVHPETKNFLCVQFNQIDEEKRHKTYMETMNTKHIREHVYTPTTRVSMFDGETDRIFKQHERCVHSEWLMVTGWIASIASRFPADMFTGRRRNNLLCEYMGKAVYRCAVCTATTPAARTAVQRGL